MKKMNKRIKKKWLWWLRSGQYDQTDGTLMEEDSGGNAKFCCLGVLCNIHAEETGEGWWEGDTYYPGPYAISGNAILPRAVADWAGVYSSPTIDGQDEKTLTRINDSGKTFKEIADLIEEHF